MINYSYNASANLPDQTLLSTRLNEITAISPSPSTQAYKPATQLAAPDSAATPAISPIAIGDALPIAPLRPLVPPVVVLATVPVVMVLALPASAAKPIAGGLYRKVE